MSQPIISIVIPVFNGEKFIEETIDSVLKQSFSNWELIIVDDGSTDNTTSLIKGVQEKDSRVTYLCKENGGQASARNLGISKAKGDWIAFLDADDLWTEEKLDIQIKLAQSNPRIDLIFSQGCEFHEVKESNKEIPIWKTGELNGDAFVKDLFVRSGIINSSVLLKTEVAKSHPLNEEKQQIGTEDWDLWLRLAIDNKTFFGQNERLVYYREHPSGIHLNQVKMLRGKEHLYLKHLESKTFSSLLFKRQLRFVYREMMNHLFKNGELGELDSAFARLRKIDKFGFGTISQSVVKKIFSRKAFMYLSNKVIYRIAYRLEKLNYYFFLK